MKSIVLVTLLFFSTQSYAMDIFDNLNQGPDGLYKIKTIEQYPDGSVVKNEFNFCKDGNWPTLPGTFECLIHVALDTSTDATAQLVCVVDERVNEYVVVERWVGNSKYSQIKGGSRYYRQESTFVGSCR